MNVSTVVVTSYTWVRIRKNKRKTKKEMNDGILEVIKERLSNEVTEERGSFSL
jgi:uncharacterized membrane protein